LKGAWPWESLWWSWLPVWERGERRRKGVCKHTQAHRSTHT
jgi:hypothetical protein